MAIAVACARGGQVVDVGLGTSVHTPQGTAVTVYGWDPGAGPGGDQGVKLRSCRTTRKGLVLDGPAFALRTSTGAVLRPGGSQLTSDGADCVTGKILFVLPAGTGPQSVTYRAGTSVFRWRLVGPPG